MHRITILIGFCSALACTGTGTSPDDAGEPASCDTVEPAAFALLLQDFIPQQYPFVAGMDGFYVAQTSMHGRDVRTAFPWTATGFSDAQVDCVDSYYSAATSVKTEYFDGYAHVMMPDDYVKQLYDGDAAASDFDENAWSAVFAVGLPIEFPDSDVRFFTIEEVSTPPNDTGSGRGVVYKLEDGDWRLDVSEPVWGFQYWEEE